MTAEDLAAIERNASQVVSGIMFGMHLDKAYTMAAMDVPLLISVIRTMRQKMDKQAAALKQARNQCANKP